MNNLEKGNRCLTEPSQIVSGIYMGHVGHTRYQPHVHTFSYPFGLLVLDLDEVSHLAEISEGFSLKSIGRLTFRPRDYLPPGTKDNTPLALKKRVLAKVSELGGESQCCSNPCCSDPCCSNLCCSKVLFAGQVRHFGVYFSPVNFFFCYQQKPSGLLARYMLAEVSNTPWGERHCYLIDLCEHEPDKPHKISTPTDKVFHVSPFLNLLMQYHWQVIPPRAKANSKLVVSIDNHLEANGSRILNAVISLQRLPWDRANLQRFGRNFRWQPLNILRRIYWHALKLFLMGIPFVPHPGALKTKKLPD